MISIEILGIGGIKLKIEVCQKWEKKTRIFERVFPVDQKTFHYLTWISLTSCSDKENDCHERHILNRILLFHIFLFYSFRRENIVYHRLFTIKIKMRLVVRSLTSRLVKQNKSSSGWWNYDIFLIINTVENLWHSS